jgi:hypothetical protein
MSTSDETIDESAEPIADRPSFMRVESFLDGIDDRRKAAYRTRWIGLGVAAAIGGVAYLTAIGIVPVEAENLVLSAGAVVAGLTLGKG